MRTFLTFFSLFAGIFFLAPLLCLSAPSAPSAEPSPVTLPEALPAEGENRSPADLILEGLAAAGVQGYGEEAQKAAAVAVTTQLLKEYRRTGSADGLPRLSPEEAKEAWGEYWFSVYWPQLQHAVTQVWGQYLTRDGLPADTPAFPLSWGKTEAGVECPYDHTSGEFETVCRVPIAEFTAVFPQYGVLLKIKNAQNGRVESVASGNAILTGEQVMEHFSLPSPAFTLTVNATEAVFRCKGRGDGRGMSLYAANERAKQGADYREILKEFYPDADLQGVNRSLGSR